MGNGGKKMKKIVIVNLLLLIGIVSVACSSKTNISKEKKTTEIASNEDKYETNIKCIDSNGKKIYNFMTDDVNKMKAWLLDYESKEKYEGVFKELIELYCEKTKKIIVPNLDGQKAVNVFVDSNQKSMNYVYSAPEIRVSIEPIDTTENTDDILKFMVDKYGIELNKKKNINNENIKNKTGYEYHEILYQHKNIQIGNSNKECIVGNMYSKKSKTQHIINFIHEDVIVKVIYFDDNSQFNLEGLNKLTFKKLWLD